MNNRKKKFKVGDMLNYLGKPVKVVGAGYSSFIGSNVYDIEYVTLDENGYAVKLDSVNETFLKS